LVHLVVLMAVTEAEPVWWCVLTRAQAYPGKPCPQATRPLPSFYTVATLRLLHSDVIPYTPHNPQSPLSPW
jgi:hypothetical protein